MNAMKKWLQAATPEEAIRLATLSKTSVAYLRQMAGGYRKEGRVGADLAQALERASIKVARAGLPKLSLGALCAACSKCKYLKGCKK